MKNCGSIFLALGLVACTPVTQNAVQYSELDKQKSMQAYKECMVANIKNLDDGISDANTIASAVASICKPKYISYLEIISSNDTPAVKKILINRANSSSQNDLVLPMVLKLRTGT